MPGKRQNRDNKRGYAEDNKARELLNEKITGRAMSIKSWNRRTDIAIET